MRVKNHLKKVREERMMSKAELARRAGLSVLTIDRIERGERCRHSTKRKILEALGISIFDRDLVFPIDAEREAEQNTSPPKESPDTSAPSQEDTERSDS
ncbi:MAG TPA: hypothetical protein DCE42_29770 [Myxococcales bacterium]|nr:hypothetical protein [Deltaproteobacteria bacterium]MBU51407.1 hypothetical protein [Deltaproteobacteria bacterium]HAA58980.1 hypothetical protein [Myxococcales bacterium]|tara:strand:+ start:9432 stop:9728 length:297 start_codon:yes stop_codon:yes gene_type:complete